MGQLEKLYVNSTGMITPVGRDSAMTALAVKAGINVYRNSSLCDGFFTPILMAEVPDEALAALLPSLHNLLGINPRTNRLLRFGAPALREAVKGVDKALPLFLAGPEPLHGRAAPLQRSFINYLQAQSGIALDQANSKVFSIGRAGLFYALDQAFSFLEFSGQSQVLVGGVDSYWDPVTLATLAQEERIKTANGQLDAFVPGEAAAFLLLSREGNSQCRQIFRPGLSEEDGHLYSAEPNLGEGLTQAFRRAIAHAGPAIGPGSVREIYASMNGESIGNKEYGVALTRNASALSEGFQCLHPADCYGDLGAASAPVLLALASINGRGNALCYAASDAAARGAVCLA